MLKYINKLLRNNIKSNQSAQHKLFSITKKFNTSNTNINLNKAGKYKEIPAMQPSHPILGNFPDIGKSGSLHEFSIEYHKKLGDIFSFYWGKSQVVSIGNPLYWNSISNLYDKPFEMFSALLPILGKNSITFANGEEAKIRRKAYIDPALSAEAIKDTYYKIIKDVLESHFSIWDEISKRGDKIPLYKESLTIALKIIARGIFGQISEEEAIQILKAYDDTTIEMEAQMAGSFPEPNSERAIKFEKALDVFRKFVIRQKENKREKTSFIDYMRGEDTERVISESVSHLVAGFHTTGCLIFWTIYYLSKNQNNLKLVQDELKNIMGNDQVVSYEKMNKLRYLKAVTNETLRFGKLIPWTGRVNFESDTIINNEYIIPKNTPIFIPLGKVLCDPLLWKDEGKFRPERFKEEGVQHKFQFSPFSFAGGRVCPGRALSYAENLMIVSGLLNNFNLTLDEDKDVIVKSDLSFVTKPVKEVYAFVSKKYY